jgi:transcriptional regulator with XRE-family HTH domain
MTACTMGKLVGNYIREHREKVGLSQGDVAKQLRLKTAQSISNIERGISPLPRAKIKKLSTILRIEKGEILTLVLRELQDRYAKAVGAESHSILLPQDLGSKEKRVISEFVDRLFDAQAIKRAGLVKKVEKLI